MNCHRLIGFVLRPRATPYHMIESCVVQHNTFNPLMIATVSIAMVSGVG
jgi:hypothetical protein